MRLNVIVGAQSNIDPTNKFDWGENIGWTSWRDADAAADGVEVGSTVMGGFIWGENVGYINVGDGAPTNGINIDADGDLHGFAWGENIGWVNFDGGAMAAPPQPARIECADLPGQTAGPVGRLRLRGRTSVGSTWTIW